MTNKQIVKTLSGIFKDGNKVLICGNGGSAAEAQHMAAELVCGMYRKKVKGFPAIALTVDTSIITAWANDIGFNGIFERQVRVLGNKGDGLIVLSTSGKSKNCKRAIKIATNRGMKIIDMPRIGTTTAKIQENHLRQIHKICAELEKQQI